MSVRGNPNVDAKQLADELGTFGVPGLAALLSPSELASWVKGAGVGLGGFFKKLKKVVKFAAPIAMDIMPATKIGSSIITKVATARKLSKARKVAGALIKAGQTTKSVVKVARAAGHRVLPGAGKVAATAAKIAGAGAAAGVGYRVSGGGRTYVENPWGSGYRKGRKTRKPKSRRKAGKRPAPFGPSRSRGRRKRAKSSKPRHWSAKQLANQKRFAAMARARRKSR